MADYWILLKEFNYKTNLYDIKPVKFKTLNTARKYSILWQKDNACGSYIYKDPEGIATYGAVKSEKSTTYGFTGMGAGQFGYKGKTTTKWYWYGNKDSYRIKLDGSKW